jgi:hypothetical protein
MQDIDEDDEIIEEDDDEIIEEDNDEEVIEEDVVFVEAKPAVYCGDKKRLPKGYEKFGSRNQCLRKGYGSAFYNADIKEMKKARKASKKKVRILDQAELYKLADRLNVDVKNKDKLTILREVTAVFVKMKTKL